MLPDFLWIKISTTYPNLVHRGKNNVENEGKSLSE
jgi:hypothetical protein